MNVLSKTSRDERGMSLVELVVGIVILSMVLLGMAGAAGLATRQTVRGRTDLQLWAAVQWKADSLVALGWGNVINGSDVVHGHAMSWIVTGTNPERIDLMVDRMNMTTLTTVQDTVVLYLSQ